MLSEDQARVYDRQLRVWGLDVQNRWVPSAEGGKNQRVEKRVKTEDGGLKNGV
jgi:hypothetical protein